MSYQQIFLIVFSYLLGSIPTGFIAGKLRGIDIRNFGSGNIGATNVIRTIGVRVGISVLLIDFLKAFVYIQIYKSFFMPNGLYWMLVLVCFFMILGNIFPIFLGFRGGKGIATSGGVFASIVPQPFLLSLLFFVLITSISRYVSLGSLVASVVLLSSSLYSYLFQKQGSFAIVVFIGMVTVVVFLKHKANIKRILAGTENKISFKKKKNV